MVRKCLLLSQRNNKCKNCMKMKNVNVHHKMKNVNVHHKMKNVNVHQYLFLSETYEPVARGTSPLFGKILKSWIFLYRSMHLNDIFLISFNFFLLSVFKPGQFFWSTLKTSPPLSGPLLLIG